MAELKFFEKYIKELTNQRLSSNEYHIARLRAKKNILSSIKKESRLTWFKDRRFIAVIGSFCVMIIVLLGVSYTAINDNTQKSAGTSQGMMPTASPISTVATDFDSQKAADEKVITDALSRIDMIIANISNNTIPDSSRFQAETLER